MTRDLHQRNPERYAADLADYLHRYGDILSSLWVPSTSSRNDV